MLVQFCRIIVIIFVKCAARIIIAPVHIALDFISLDPASERKKNYPDYKNPFFDLLEIIHIRGLRGKPLTSRCILTGFAKMSDNIPCLLYLKMIFSDFFIFVSKILLYNTHTHFARYSLFDFILLTLNDNIYINLF